MNSETKPSPLDDLYFDMLRTWTSEFWVEIASRARRAPGTRMLEIAPQVHGGMVPLLAGSAVDVVVLDKDPESGADVIGDICETNPELGDAEFDMVVCTHVLEHVADPFAAVAEIRRVLKPGGIAFVVVPLNFRIHGPLPDNWRFTEHGCRALFRQFVTVEVTAQESPDRPLMPIQYRVAAVK